MAQASKYEGRNIAVILFVPDQQPLDGEQLYEILPLKMHTPLRMADVRASIQRLYATGEYEDIQVDAEPRGNDVIIRFITRNSWFIGHVSAAGNISHPPNAGQVVNVTQLELGQPFTDEKVAQAATRAKQLLEKNGLYESSVQPVFNYDPVTQQVHLQFVIHSGHRARFATPILKGDWKMSPDRVISATKWRRWLIGTWRPVTGDRVQKGLEGIRSKYQGEGRLEAKVGLESMQYDADTRRARATLNGDAGPKIQLRPIGTKLSKKTLKRYVPVYEEHTVDHDLLVEGQRNLRDYLQSQGYFEAQVEFKQQRVAQDRAAIDYLINKGRRHRLVHIGIQGNKYFTTETIQERMMLTRASFLQFRHGRYSETYLRQDEDSIANLYKSNGFRDVSVSSKTVDDYQGKVGDIAVFISIDEGPQWFVASLDVGGIRRLDKNRILQRLSSVAGQPFSEFNVAVDRDTILEEYFTSGFPNASFEWSSKPAAQPHQVDLKFVITEGPQKFVRQVLISGLKTTRPRLVNRSLELNPGDPLSPTQIREVQRRLYDLGVFAQVDTAIQNPDGETARKYVLYDMDEAGRYSLATGLGAEVARIGGGSSNTLEAPGGRAGFSPRVSADVTRLNLWGLAQSLSLRTRISTLENRGLLNYSVPRFRNQEGLNLSFTALYDKTRDVRTFNAKRLEGATQLSQRLTKATTLFYRYTYRRVSVTSLKITPLLLPLLTQPVRLGMFSGNLIEDRRDDPADPRRGRYNTVDLGLAEKIFGSQRDFLRFLGRNATYHHVGKKMVLARTTSFGVLHPFRFAGDASQAIPLPERFFAGGGASHRGFPENQAGPRDTVTGFPLGGRTLLFNQTELRLPLVGDNLGGVFFHDAGNVYSSVSNISFRIRQRDLKDFDYMVHAVGFGIRYRTPIGPVRVDLAYSINAPRFFGFKGTPQELINAGINPCQTAPAKCVVQSISHFQFFFSIGQTF